MNVISQSVSINYFVRPQVQSSGKTYATGITFTEIVSHAKKQLNIGNYTEGYRDGVIVAPVEQELIHHFVCPFVQISETTRLKAEMVQRRPEEKPYIQIRALNGIPLKTGSVELILYHHDVLAETNEQTTDADWELISFHAIPKAVSYTHLRAHET